MKTNNKERKIQNLNKDKFRKKREKDVQNLNEDRSKKKERKM